MIQQIQKEIEQVKQKLDVAIMAHSYQGHEILEVADAVGDTASATSRISCPW